MSRSTGQPVLRTQRLRLVPLAEEYLEHEVALDADPAVMRYLGNGRPRAREQVEDRHRGRLAVARRVPGLGFWAGFTDDDDGGSGESTFVCWWILEPPDRPDQGPVEGQAELGFRLLPRFWRQGLAKEGALRLLRYGFEEAGLGRVFAETMTVNEASRATMRALGMRYVRTFRMEFDEAIPGVEHGQVEYAITRDEWQAGLDVKP